MDIQHNHAQQQYKIEGQLERQHYRASIGRHLVARSATRVVIYTLV